jgi:hypothetical protein
VERLRSRIIADSNKELDEGLSMYNSTVGMVRAGLKERGLSSWNLCLSCTLDTRLGSLKSAWYNTQKALWIIR